MPPPESTFRVREEFAWSSILSEPAGATAISLVLAQVREGGSESVVYTQDITLAQPGIQIVAYKHRMGDLVERKAGTYVMRFYRDTTLLAEGTFTLRR